MAQQPEDDNTADEILNRADALLSRHRRKEEKPSQDVPVLSDPADPQDVPTLTEIVVLPPEGSGAAADGAPEPRTELISRVQAQNMEHKVVLRVRKHLDQQIDNVMRERFMPEVGTALDQALQKITEDLHVSINQMVRNSIAENLNLQLKHLRFALEAKAAAQLEAGQGSGIIPGFSGTPPAAAEDMELPKSFEPAAIESHWYPLWEKGSYFQAGLDSAKTKHFCILLPPPNVTGTLHMGHGFNHTIMDALTRYHRMRGDNTLWQPGTDHAGIATQIVVERQLEAQGVSRHDLGREQFIAKVWEWKETSGSTITRQMRRLGDSCDWSRERFTMDAGLSKTVTETFVRLYREGLIYRGKRLVNWDPKLHTAVSDLEVESEEEDGFLWHIRYPLAVGSGHLTVATTRPETLLGDTAVIR